MVLATKLRLVRLSWPEKIELNNMRSLTENTYVGLTVSDTPTNTNLQELHRYAELGRLSAHLLHEISNPLTAAMLHLEHPTHQQTLSIRRAKRNMLLLQRYIEAVRQQLRRESIVQRFSTKSQLEQVKRIITPLARSRGVKLHIDISNNYYLVGDPIKFQQIIANLVVNAVDAYQTKPDHAASKGVIVQMVQKSQWLIITVTDYGGGILPTNLPHIFKPFYTTKGSGGNGLGIGLTAIKRYIETDFGGSISVRSTLHGTSFEIRLYIKNSAKG